MVMLERHSVARGGADLNHFVRMILNIENLCLSKSPLREILFGFHRVQIVWKVCLNKLSDLMP